MSIKTEFTHTPRTAYLPEAPAWKFSSLAYWIHRRPNARRDWIQNAEQTGEHEWISRPSELSPRDLVTLSGMREEGWRVHITAEKKGTLRLTITHTHHERK